MLFYVARVSGKKLYGYSMKELLEDPFLILQKQPEKKQYIAFGVPKTYLIEPTEEILHENQNKFMAKVNGLYEKKIKEYAECGNSLKEAQEYLKGKVEFFKGKRDKKSYEEYKRMFEENEKAYKEHQANEKSFSETYSNATVIANQVFYKIVCERHLGISVSFYR